MRTRVAFRTPSEPGSYNGEPNENLGNASKVTGSTTTSAKHAQSGHASNTWNLTAFKHLPDWLKDNEFLHEGHRPQIGSLKDCFKSIFSVHTETGNIWSHLLGLIAFVGIAFYVLVAESKKLPESEKWVFVAFFCGEIVCFGFSFLFHTLNCHSLGCLRLFKKLDYCGIALVILGSFVPWLHFGFYCKPVAKMVYIAAIGVLSSSAIIVSLWDKFSEPDFRAIRAGVFVALGWSAAIPAVHHVGVYGWGKSVEEGSIHWLLLMGVLYAFGAALYACRFPEKWFPGRFDIWFQSHQIFHVLVVAAAFVHYHTICLMSSHRFAVGVCPGSISDHANINIL